MNETHASDYYYKSNDAFTYIFPGFVPRNMMVAINKRTRAEKYDLTIVALVKYKDLQGHMLVPGKFIVPIGNLTWPEQTWGMKLGISVSRIRSGKIYKHKREELESIGFNFESKAHRYDLVKTALLTYQDLYNDMLVPQRFKVPGGDVAWPEGTWNMTLGYVVNTIRTGNSHVDKREDLESIGFDYSSQSLRHGYDLVKTALLTYKVLHKDMLVPYKFVVPDGDDAWPEKTWNMSLRVYVNNIRRGHSYVDKREDLLSIGFDFNPQQLRYGYDLIKTALLAYKVLHNDMLVPYKFVVPDGDVAWPKETWNMTLGYVVDTIRRGKSHVDKREDLLSIGFDYSSQSLHHGYDLVKTALLTYQDL
jgi:hypothetical protein